MSYITTTDDGYDKETLLTDKSSLKLLLETKRKKKNYSKDDK